MAKIAKGTGKIISYPLPFFTFGLHIVALYIMCIVTCVHVYMCEIRAIIIKIVTSMGCGQLAVHDLFCHFYSHPMVILFQAEYNVSAWLNYLFNFSVILCGNVLLKKAAP